VFRPTPIPWGSKHLAIHFFFPKINTYWCTVDNLAVTVVSTLDRQHTLILWKYRVVAWTCKQAVICVLKRYKGSRAIYHSKEIKCKMANAQSNPSNRDFHSVCVNKCLSCELNCDYNNLDSAIQDSGQTFFRTVPSCRKDRLSSKFTCHSRENLWVPLTSCSLTSVRALLTVYIILKKIKRNPWPESASELYQPSDRRLPAKLVPTFCG
jgi:hypothetical protein